MQFSLKKTEIRIEPFRDKFYISCSLNLFFFEIVFVFINTAPLFYLTNTIYQNPLVLRSPCRRSGDLTAFIKELTASGNRYLSYEIITICLAILTRLSPELCSEVHVISSCIAFFTYIRLLTKVWLYGHILVLQLCRISRTSVQCFFFRVFTRRITHTRKLVDAFVRLLFTVALKKYYCIKYSPYFSAVTTRL